MPRGLQGLHASRQSHFRHLQLLPSAALLHCPEACEVFLRYLERMQDPASRKKRETLRLRSGQAMGHPARDGAPAHPPALAHP